MTVIQLQKPALTVHLTEAERWALTKSIMLTSKTQTGNYEPEDLDSNDIFTVDEYKALFSALDKLNQAFKEVNPQSA
jgi:hypothetical protein